MLNHTSQHAIDQILDQRMNANYFKSVIFLTIQNNYTEEVAWSVHMMNCQGIRQIL